MSGDLPDARLAAHDDHLREFAADVRRGLALQPKQLPPQYFYDELGVQLFEAICRLPWYRITRAERRLLDAHAPRILARLRAPVTLVELGCGSGEKLAMLVRAVQAAGPEARVHLVDISPVALELSERALRRVTQVPVTTHQTPYEAGLQAVAQADPHDGARLVLFLGSNIGNFDPPAAQGFLQMIRHCSRSGDALLLGADLVKAGDELVLAYDDPLGVTAAFNKNVLLRINRELQATFDLDAFEHRAVWNPAVSRVEMHLVSRREQEVHVPAAGCTVRLAPGETIWTESSYKYEPEGVTEMGRQAGFESRELWIEPAARFALALFEVAN